MSIRREGESAVTLITAGISAGGGVGYVVSGAALSGLALGCSAVASTTLGTSAMEDERGLASGLLNSSTQVGTAIGLAVLFTVAAARGHPDRRR